MKKEAFEKLSVDHKYIVIHEYVELIKLATNNRMGLLPTTATLSAALLVVATFNQNIANLDFDIRIITSILLILIPVSLFLYNEDQKLLSKKAKKEYEELIGEIPRDDQGLIGKLTSWMPDIVIYIFAILSIILILKFFIPIC